MVEQFQAVLDLFQLYEFQCSNAWGQPVSSNVWEPQRGGLLNTTLAKDARRYLQENVRGQRGCPIGC